MVQVGLVGYWQLRARLKLLQPAENTTDKTQTTNAYNKIKHSLTLNFCKAAKKQLTEKEKRCRTGNITSACCCRGCGAAAGVVVAAHAAAAAVVACVGC